MNGSKSNITVSGNKITSTLSEYGEDKIKTDQKFELTWYKDGSTEFEVMQALVEAFGGSLKSEATYSIAGDKMTLMMGNEKKIYTKQ